MYKDILYMCVYDWPCLVSCATLGYATTGL